MSDKKGLSRREILTIGGAAGAAALVTGASPALARKLPQVPRRVLGKTGQKIPILLFGGAVPLNPRFDPKLAEAYSYGVNYIDAADCYSNGRCEPAVGNFLKKSRLRKKIWLTSKSDAHDATGFAARFQQSLNRMGTDHIDLYFLHALVNGAYLNKTLEKTVATLKKSGKMRYFGFSCHNKNVVELLQKAAATPWVDAVMFRYNFRNYGDKALNKAIDACAKANVGLIAMKTQGSEASFRDAWKKFEKTGKWTKHQAVLKAVWNDKRITAAVSHMDTLTKLRQNIAAALDRSKLTQAEVEALDRYAATTRGLACDGCDHICGPKVAAPVRVGDTMRYLMYHDAYGDRGKAIDLFAKLPPEARALSGVDFAPATAACPHGVDLVAHMKRAAAIFKA